MTGTKEIAILGAGAWGKALAKTFSKKKENSVTVWSREHDHSVITDKVEDIIIIALPAQTIRMICQKLKSIKKTTTIIIGSKGIESSTLSLLTEVIQEELNHDNVAVISGPNFAHEIQAGLPSAATLACQDETTLVNLVVCLSSASLKLHPSKDVIGVQIYGAVKNVIAIACGIFYEKELGNNAVAALITAGLKEITKLCITKKGDPNTALELCGIGDIILTATSLNSRNVSFGITLAQGSQGIKGTIEGVHTAKTVYLLSQKLGIEMPICRSIYNIIYKKVSLDFEIKNMLNII